MCNSITLRFIKKEEANRLFGTLWIKTRLNNIAILDDILF